MLLSQYRPESTPNSVAKTISHQFESWQAQSEAAQNYTHQPAAFQHGHGNILRPVTYKKVRRARISQRGKTQTKLLHHRIPASSYATKDDGDCKSPPASRFLIAAAYTATNSSWRLVSRACLHLQRRTCKRQMTECY